MKLVLDAQMILRLAGLLICLVGLVSWSVWIRRNKRYRLLAVGPVSYILHLILFYAYNIIQPGILTNAEINTWSLAIRLQAAIMISFAGVIMTITRTVK